MPHVFQIRNPVGAMAARGELKPKKAAPADAFIDIIGLNNVGGPRLFPYGGMWREVDVGRADLCRCSPASR